MKVIFKRTIFLTIIALIVFTLVASSGTRHHILSQYNQNSDNCVIVDSLGDRKQSSQRCTNIPKNITSSTTYFNSERKLTGKLRFLAAITDKLLTIPQSGTYEYTLLRAYGAAFVNQDPEIKLPTKVIFNNEQETQDFQATLTMAKVNDSYDCYLQKAAADALNRAKAQVIIPLKSGYGDSDCTRSFTTTVRFWRKYANDITLARVRQGEETKILGTVAPPGSSQHLWGIAIDLRVSNEVQKQALNRNGWFRTVENDIPHWTYVGYPPEKLSEFGFKNKVVSGVSYWLTPL
ncbi:D-alanyl-D-alanine carboxypeptidase family protein [Fischerella sp. PCC 9605]|uniref:D-alanyl-D-alanine carboxypeptidase family protein n=1 Tax=Fischerella sp. PCC 9605 TaxID=1173024 RepID=UPI00047C6C76|nr:D-alanyl-D-alanine carboxypeptidase family protein [Fischerella sp. PCC 9605]